MKTKIISIVVMLLMACNVMAQDYMRVYFKDGTSRKFYLKNITEMSTKKEDANGVQHNNYDYQHITTLQEGFVYDLNEVDSITFGKFYEEKAKKNFYSSVPAVLNVIKNCSTIKDVERNLEIIKNSEGIEDAWSDGQDLHVKIAYGEEMTFAFMPHGEESEEDSYNSSPAYIKANQSVESADNPVVNTRENLKAVIIDQTYHNDELDYVSSACDKIVQQFDDCGITAILNTRPTIEFFYSEFFTYDIILLVTHGDYENGIHSFFTADELGRVKEYFIGTQTEMDLSWEYCYNLLCNLRDKYGASDDHISMGWIDEERNGDTYYIMYACIKEAFFEDITKNKKFKNPFSIMFSTACRSLEGIDGVEGSANSLAKKFTNKGLGLYFGYTKSIACVRAKNAFSSFYENMLNGCGITKAISLIPSSSKQDAHSGAELNFVANDDIDEAIFNSLFLLPTYTIEHDQESLNEKYFKDNLITLGGITTTLNPDKITKGILIGNDREHLNTNFPSNVDMATFVKGNRLFSSTITNLQPGKTYYYCAYTHDGWYYNCGDTLSFYVPFELQLSTQDLSLIAGSTTTVEITSGNGGYTLYVDKPTIATATLSGTTITIKGESKGTAKVTVKDKSGQTAEIIVSVESDYPDEDTRSLAFDYELEGTRYALYWQSEQNDVRYNADHTPYYRTKFTLDVTNNGSTKTYMVDENVYYTKEGGGQIPCMAIDLKSKKIFIFVNSSNGYSYSLDGYCFVSPLYNYNFQKEIVFSEANFGWWPYFTYNNGKLYLQHFSFAGYYAMTSTRSSNGTWTTDWGYQIYPDEFKTLSEQAGRVLIIR